MEHIISCLLFKRIKIIYILLNRVISVSDNNERMKIKIKKKLILWNQNTCECKNKNKNEKELKSTHTQKKILGAWKTEQHVAQKN